MPAFANNTCHSFIAAATASAATSNRIPSSVAATAAAKAKNNKPAARLVLASSAASVSSGKSHDSVATFIAMCGVPARSNLI
ncbi:hypothetical protein HDU88_008277 [Geranomyces variabilis]|nr:hypothetical protein HDU88_008277 [Geranomyces variabilis]